MYGRELSSGWSNIRCSWGKSVEMFVCLGAITAYTLMSDEHGRGYRAQAVDYMKETLGIQGIQLLMKNMNNRKIFLNNRKREGVISM